MPKRSNSFGDIEFYQAKKRIKERFHKVLTALRETVKQNGYAVQSIERFRGCLNIRKSGNSISELPVFSTRPYSPTHSKIYCVLCLVSFTVQYYWAFCNGAKECETIITESLTDLESYVTEGLDAFEVVKLDGRRLYYLKKKV